MRARDMPRSVTLDTKFGTGGARPVRFQSAVPKRLANTSIAPSSPCRDRPETHGFRAHRVWSVNCVCRVA